MTVRDFGKELRRCRGRKGLSQAELAVLAKVSQQTVRNLEGLNPPLRPLRTTVIAVAAAAGMNVDESLAMVGYAPVPYTALTDLAVFEPDMDLRAELDRLWPELTDEQRRTLVAVARIVLGRAPLPTLGAPQHDGHGGDGDGVVLGSRAPQHYDDDREAYGFRMLVIDADVVARITDGADPAEAPHR